MRPGLALTLALLVLASSASADDQSPIHIQAPSPTRLGSGTSDYFVTTKDPTFQIAVNMSQEPGAVSAQCKFDYQQVPVPCDNPHTDGCPQSMCWTATGHYDQEGVMDDSLTVTLDDADGNDVDSNGIFFAISTAVPDTTVAAKPDISTPGEATFDFASPQATSDISTYFPPSYQCSVTPADASAPGAWSACRPQQMVFHVKVSERYRFWVRALDWVGRADPTPASTVFSDTPCSATLASRPRTLSALVRGGLHVRLSCVQPTAFSLTLLMTNAFANRLHLLSAALGNEMGGAVDARQLIRTVTYPVSHRLSKLLFRQRRIPLVLDVGTSGAGAKLAFSVRG